MQSTKTFRVWRSMCVLLFFVTSISCVQAQPPSGYYDAADGIQGGATLKTAFFNIIKNPDVLSYNGLLDAFKTTDRRPDNGKVWDMYSDVPGGTAPYYYNFGETCGNYSGEGSCYNREHSFPKSWFGGKVPPMNSDLFHLYPTDGKVNGQRGSYPYGEVGIANWTSQNGSKRGDNTFGSYRGTVFEPIDAYKGDFARSYFYMVTAYENRVAAWNSPQLGGNSYPAFSTWSKDMLLKWHREDPVSQKEIDRNNAVYGFQHNRNPYIDFPDLAEYVWGTKTNQVFKLDGSGGVDPSPTTVTVETDFKSSLDPFTEFSVSGAQSWSSNSKYGGIMSGYVKSESAAYPNEDWLISSTLDLSNAISAKLWFSHAINFSSSAKLQTSHTLWISDDYDSENPTIATWTSLTIPNYPSGNNWTYVESGVIDFPASFIRKENVHIAFKYLSDNQEASTWEISPLTIEIKNNATSLQESIDKHVSIRTRSHTIFITLDKTLPSEKIILYDTCGKKITEKSALRGTVEIPVLVTPSIYVVKVGNYSRKILAR